MMNSVKDTTQMQRKEKQIEEGEEQSDDSNKYTFCQQSQH